MLPMLDLRIALGELLAADVATLAPVAANKIALIAANVALTENTVFADLVLATFTGSTPKAGAAGAQQAGIDPLTGDQVITILAPAGGWRWECTVVPGAPESIFGYALVDNAVAVLIAAQLFDVPISISEVGNFIDLGSVPIRFVRTPMQ